MNAVPHEVEALIDAHLYAPLPSDAFDMQHEEALVSSKLLKGIAIGMLIEAGAALCLWGLWRVL